jgi:hypothetical protein
MPRLNSLYVKVVHVTKIDVTNSGIGDSDTIAHAMDVLPLTYPQSVGYSMQRSARVPDGIDVNLSLHKFLSERPLGITYDIFEPLSATPPDDPSLLIRIANLEAEIMALRKRQESLERDMKGEVVARKVADAARKVDGAVLKVEVKDLRAEVDLLMAATLTGLPVFLRILLDAHLMQLGFIPYSQSRSRFVAANVASLAEATSVPQNQVAAFFQSFFSNPLFSQYRNKGNHTAHATTSLGIAHAITHIGLNAHDLLTWESIFQHTFYRSIAEQLDDGRETVWIVDAQQDAVTSRFTFVDSRQR